jgi:hypothetical protein
MTRAETVHCRQCRHYYVTWDAKAPYGCRKLGFKSALSPGSVVIRSSGTRCLYFESKIHAAGNNEQSNQHT